MDACKGRTGRNHWALRVGGTQMSVSGRSLVGRSLACVVALWLAGVAAAQDWRLPGEYQTKCVAHDFNVPGQGFYISGSGFYISGSGFYISGSAGGMVRGDITFVDPSHKYPNTTLFPQTVGQIMASAGVPSSGVLFDLTMGRDVVIVVADDFAGGAFALPAALRDPFATETTLELLARLAEDGEFSHGALVMHHLNAAIADLRVFRPAHDPDRPELTVWTHENGENQLVVVGLDLSSFGGGTTSETELIDEGEIATALDSGIATLERSLPEGVVDPMVVVNLSWVLLPCPTVEAFLANRDSFQTFEEYVAGLGFVPAGVLLEDVIAEMNKSTNPALQEILDSDTMPDVRFVAAAGNFSLGYQMFPAAWRRVVGVAVSPVTRTFPDRYSNRGDVHIPGEWVTFQALDETGVLGPETILSYAGTSYASPLVALYVALDGAGPMRCAGTAGLSSPLVLDPSDPTPADIPLIQAIDGCPP